MGLALLIMSLLIRLASMSKADTVVDDLAILASAVATLLGAVYVRFGPER